MEQRVEWTGTGRWMAFVGCALLIVVANFQMIMPYQAITAGLSIFLALILLATVASGSRAAPQIALGLAVVQLMLVIATLSVLMTLGFPMIGAALGLIPLPAIIWAAWDLGKQQPG